MVFQRLSSIVARGPSTAAWIAGFPVLLWCHDSFGSICRVRGTSMEPSFKDGDILLVRTSDNLLWDYFCNKETEEIFLRQTLQEFEAIHCSVTPAATIQKPPLPLTGDIVVYKDPSDYGAARQKLNVKRVVGLGGQIVMVPSKLLYEKNESNLRMNNHMTEMRIASTCVAPYSMWLQGDNSANSVDSRNPQHGAISKNLLVGVAEYVLWPPTRIGKVKDIPAPEPRPQSYWP